MRSTLADEKILRSFAARMSKRGDFMGIVVRAGWSMQREAASVTKESDDLYVAALNRYQIAQA
jgi:hypothetical protein